MKRLLDILRFVIISPEMILVLLSGLLWLFDFSFFSKVGESIKTSDDFLKYAFLIPSVFLTLSFRLHEQIRAPLESANNKQLYEWPGYQMLIDRAIASIVIIAVCTVVSIVLWIYVTELAVLNLGALLVMIVIVSGISLSLLYFAKSRLVEILIKYGEVK